MRKNFTLLFILFSVLVTAQDKIIFNYDMAGNQALREICLNCTSKSSVKSVRDLKKDDLQQIDQISYYPNPVSEQLYLTWELVPDKKIVQIQLFASSGKLLQTYFPSSGEMSIGFQGYPSGLYFVLLHYNNEEQKTMKIVKK